MRYDLFIVWSTGIPHLNEIMVTLRSKFEILLVKRHMITGLYKFGGIAKFVDDVYACDSYPLEHLKAKTRYLLDTDPICFLILVKNHHVNEQMVGSPPYRKPQCLYLQGIKNQIRAKFNKIPHNHVIHGTDYESQVDHILKLFGLQKKEVYGRKLDFDYPWHLPKPRMKTKIMVGIDSLKVFILGSGEVHIKESPHYKYVQGDKEAYIAYHKMYRGMELTDDHFPERFDDMIKLYEWGEFEPIIIQGNRVIDGVHRLALMADDFKSIRAYHVQF